MKIRPFQDTEADCAAFIALNRLLEPQEDLTIALFRQREREFAANKEVVRVLGEVDDRVVASGVYWRGAHPADAPHHFAFRVHPDHQEGSVPGQMHYYLLARIAQQQPSAIVSEAKADERYRTQLLEDSGFELKMRFLRSQLDVTQVDPTAYDALQAQLSRQGIAFVTLSEVMKADPDWQRQVWQLFTVIEQDVPSPEPGQTTPFEQYAEYYEGEWFRPDSWAIAVDTTQSGGRHYVGMCVVNIMPARPDTLFAGITGVVPSHRRRKIATILKVYSIRYAQQYGYRYIYTDNEEDNPMYRLNRQLGFEPLPAWLYYGKETGAAS